MAWYDYLKPIGFGNPVIGKKHKNFGTDLLTGTPEKHKRVSTLLPEQQALADQLFQAGQGEGAGGAFGASADYYRNLLGDDSADFNAFAAPQIRQFNEETVPGLSEQFAGMGSGGLSSSGFRNAAINAGTDLSERLGAIRSQLRQQGAQGLQGIGQSGLQNFSQDVMTQPGSQGLLGSFAPAIGTAAGAAIGGPAGAFAGNSLGSSFRNMFSNKSSVQQPGVNSFGQNKVGAKTDPYGLPNRSF